METTTRTKHSNGAPARPNNLAPLADPHVREFVTAARLAHLATADADGAPHNVPLCYWFDGERIYFAIDEKPKRQTGLAQADAQHRGESARRYRDRSL